MKKILAKIYVVLFFLAIFSIMVHDIGIVQALMIVGGVGSVILFAFCFAYILTKEKP